MPTKRQRQTLDYATPRRQSWVAELAKAVAVRVVVAVLLFVGAMTLPHPEGIWYFGRYPDQWILAIDSAGLTIGNTSDVPRTSGWAPVIVVKLIAYALPVWLIWRYGFRSPRAATKHRR